MSTPTVTQTRAASAAIVLAVFCGVCTPYCATAQDSGAVENQAAPAETPLFATVLGTDKPQTRGTRIGFSLDTQAEIAPKHIEVLIDGVPVGAVSRVRGGFTFQIPGCTTPYVPLGKHDVEIKYRPEPNAEAVLAQFSGAMPQLEIAPRNGGVARPVIKGVFPTPAYPQEKGATYDNLRIQGDGFARDECDNEIAFGGEWIQVCWEGNKCASDAVSGTLMSSREIRLSNLKLGNHDFSNIRISVGGYESEPANIRLSRVARGMPLAWAIGGFLIIVGIVLFTTSRGFRGYTIAGTKYKFPEVLLLDKENDSYSLSRFQFFIWTAAAIFGYLYLAISRSLVQGNLEFVDIPDGLPGIILISASTSMLATWTSSARGPKGGGNEKPSFSDLITTGGLVAPERFQFFIWTIIGVIAFLALVVLRDPGTISDLPKVPDGFLQLMGVSSAGYLGGKLARKPGPVIHEIIASHSSLKLTIRGRNLSRNASFRIGSDVVGSDKVFGDTEDKHKPKLLEPEDDGADASMAKTIEITIVEPLPAWLESGAEFTIINPDGQKASKAYQIKAPPAEKPETKPETPPEPTPPVGFTPPRPRPDLQLK
jgi:hypothetical protein